MSFNDWFSVSHQPLSIATHSQHMTQQHYHHFYHYHYSSMATTMAHPSQSHCQHQCHHKQEFSNLFAVMPPMPTMVTHQVASIKLRRCVSLFLHLIDSSSVSDFLQHDKHFRHADKYLLAMALIYFWRAKLREHHFTKDSFYLALWLAHDSVEEDLSAKYGLLPWALQTHDGDLSMDLKNDFKRFLTKKNDLWTRMGFRARVTKDECDQIMLVQPNHWIWQRERTDDYHSTIAMLNRRQKHRASDQPTSCSSSVSVSPADDTNSETDHRGQSVPLVASMDTNENDDC